MTSPSTPDTRIALLETLLVVRRHEEKLASIAGASPGTCTSVGQEASAVGAVTALAPCDRLLTNHRSAGHLIARGADPGRLMAEVMGRVDGYCKGKSGSLHVSARDLGVVLTSTIVGGELSLAPGVALAQKMGGAGTEPGGITAVFFGDGAACEGILHESVNLAVMWRLPLLFVCENNQWQAFVRRDETMPNAHVATWLEGHGLPVRTVDGNDVEAVLAATREAADLVRRSGSPAFLELLTYRTRGHFEPDDQSYVDPQELARWRARDPIDLLRDRLIDERVLAPGEVAHLEQRAAAVVDAAFAFAQRSPWPDVAERSTDVYAD